MVKTQKQFTHTRLPSGALATTTTEANHEGAVAYSKDAKTELFTLAAVHMAGESAFYETAGERDTRFTNLVRQCTEEDDRWTRQMIGWLRTEGNMRTASLIAACEYVRAGGSQGRGLVNGVCMRADEPGEIVAYWLGTVGRKMPAPIKRGVADAAARLYTPRNAVKWDSGGNKVRFGDVVELTHPKPVGELQSNLFKRLIEDRHNRDTRTGVAELDQYKQWIKDGAALDRLPEVVTWENLSAHHKMNGEAWEAVVPHMGYMALLRNLRNIEQAGVNEVLLSGVERKLSSPGDVKRSRQFPFRFWTAWKHSGTMRFGSALEKALEHSVSNVPRLSGKTLIMVDKSGSMSSPMSGRSKFQRWEAAVLFGCALAKRCDDVALVAYADQAARFTDPMTSVLRMAERMSQVDVGGSTHTWDLTHGAWGKWGPFDRIVILTDEQSYGSGYGYRTRARNQYNQWGNSPQYMNDSTWVPTNVPVYSWDLAGYKTVSFELGAGRYQLGGLTDACFRLIPLLERAGAGWPWETEEVVETEEVSE